MPYQFTSVLKTFKQADKDLASSNDAAKLQHDRKVYAAIKIPFDEVKKFYTEFENFLAEAKTNGKYNMDGIVELVNNCKGNPEPNQLKLLENSLHIIKDIRAKLGAYQQTMKNDLMDWRGGWDVSCASIVFDTKTLEAMKAFRKMMIDKQAGEWNSTIARIDQYATRADAIVHAAAEKAAKSGDGSETLAKIKDAHSKAIMSGVKSVITYVENLDTSFARLKTEAKKGIDQKDKPKAANLWKIKEAQFAQYVAYRKDISGAGKTLTMLTKLIANGMSKAAKTQQGEWQAEFDEIKRDLGKLEGLLERFPEMQKIMDTIKKQYQDAIHGK